MNEVLNRPHFCNVENKIYNTAPAHLLSEALGAQIPKAINFVTSRKAGRTEAGAGGHTCLSREVIFP